MDVPILAAIDQADDLFAGPEDRQPFRRRFLEELAAAVREQPMLHLLVSVRSDVLPRFSDVIGNGVAFHLDPLQIEGARAAVQGPGFFSAEAADDLVLSMRTSRIVSAHGQERLIITDEVEPALLQITCARLWEELRAQYSQVGMRELRAHDDVNVDAVLAGYCSAAIAAVAAVHEIPVAWLRSWLIDTFITEVGDLDVATEEQAETAGAPATILRALEDRYLLRAQAGEPSGSRLYKLISDRMIEPLRHAPVGAPPPVDPDECLRAAERALSAGELNLAEKYAMTVLENAPDTALRWHAEARSLLGDLAYERGHFDEAEEHYQAAAELAEAGNDRAAVARLLIAISRTLSDRGRFADALTQLRAALNRATSDASVIEFELSRVMTELAQRSSDGPRWDTPSS